MLSSFASAASPPTISAAACSSRTVAWFMGSCKMFAQTGRSDKSGRSRQQLQGNSGQSVFTIRCAAADGLRLCGLEELEHARLGEAVDRDGVDPGRRWAKFLAPEFLPCVHSQRGLCYLRCK